MAKDRRGRPTKLTKRVRDKIVSAIRAGNYAVVAAASAGIGEKTYYVWLEKGKLEEEAGTEGVYRQFAQAIKEARAAAEEDAVSCVVRAMPNDWKAAMTLLERTRPERWGRKERLDVTVSADPEAELAELLGTTREKIAALKDRS